MTSSQNQIAVEEGGGLVPFMTQERRGLGPPWLSSDLTAFAGLHLRWQFTKARPHEHESRLETRAYFSQQFTADDAGVVRCTSCAPAHGSLAMRIPPSLTQKERRGPTATEHWSLRSDMFSYVHSP